jgi:hypothetical protein
VVLLCAFDVQYLRVESPPQVATSCASRRLTRAFFASVIEMIQEDDGRHLRPVCRAPPMASPGGGARFEFGENSKGARFAVPI